MKLRDFAGNTIHCMKLKLLSALAATAILAGCASPHVVETTKLSDSKMTCTQIQMEMAEADRFRADAQKEKGMTGTNVAAALFFLPAMIGTYSNANEAISAADKRKSNLIALYNEKRCDGSVATGGAGAEQTTEARLKSLKSMLDGGLITKSEFDERRAKIVSAM